MPKRNRSGVSEAYYQQQAKPPIKAKQSATRIVGRNVLPIIQNQKQTHFFFSTFLATVVVFHPERIARSSNCPSHQPGPTSFVAYLLTMFATEGEKIASGGPTLVLVPRFKYQDCTSLLEFRVSCLHKREGRRGVRSVLG